MNKTPRVKKPIPRAGTKAKPIKKRFLEPPDSRKANMLFISFFLILAFVLYGKTILNKYAVDDELVTNNEVVAKGLKAVPEIFSTFYVSKSGNVGSQSADYRPMVKLTFALEYQLWGPNKAGRSHIVNILLYFLLSVLLFFILRRLFRSYNILFPFLVTVVFMVHPLHTEVVASLKNRDEMLAFLCGLGTLHFILRYTDTGSIRFFFYGMAVFVVGYLSKTSIVPFLFIYPLVLYFFTGVRLRTILVVFLALGLLAVVTQIGPKFFLPSFSRTNSFIENPLYFEKNIWLRLGTGFSGLLFYLKMLVFPYPLIYYYGYDMIPVTGIWNWKVLLSVAIHLTLFLYAFSRLKNKHPLSFAIFFYLVFISMYSNILFPVPGIVAERFAFAATTGFCIAFVYLVFRLFRTDPRSLTIEFSDRVKILALVVVVIVPAAYYTVKRNRPWRKLYDLYVHDIKYQERSAKSNIQFAGHLMNMVYTAKPEDQDMLRQSFTPYIISYFKKGITLYPKNYEALNDLGSVYVNFANEPDSAVMVLKKAIELDSAKQPAWVNLGLSYRKLQKYDSAIFCYNKILELNPDELKAVFAIANIYHDIGEYARAFRMNEEVMKSHPGLDIPYVNLGNYCIVHGDTANAVRYWEQAAQRNPSYQTCMQLNQMYRLKGDIEKANYFYNLAMEADRKTK